MRASIPSAAAGAISTDSARCGACATGEFCILYSPFSIEFARPEEFFQLVRTFAHRRRLPNSARNSHWRHVRNIRLISRASLHPVRAPCTLVARSSPGTRVCVWCQFARAQFSTIPHLDSEFWIRMHSIQGLMAAGVHESYQPSPGVRRRIQKVLYDLFCALRFGGCQLRAPGRMTPLNRDGCATRIKRTPTSAMMRCNQRSISICACPFEPNRKMNVRIRARFYFPSSGKWYFGRKNIFSISQQIHFLNFTFHIYSKPFKIIRN